MRKMQVLITAGGTQEPIDGVRFITNFSTGRTGACLAECITAAGHNVYFLHGRLCTKPKGNNIEMEEYGSFENLDRKLHQLLTNRQFRLIIHAAAVSDYSVASVEIDGVPYKPGELPKTDSNTELTIRTRYNHKIIGRLKEYVPTGQRHPFIVGFKLTNIADTRYRQAEIIRQVSRVTADMVVHNDLNDVQSGKPNLYSIFRGSISNQLIGENLTLFELVRTILEEVEQ